MKKTKQKKKQLDYSKFVHLRSTEENHMAQDAKSAMGYEVRISVLFGCGIVQLAKVI